MTSVDKNERKIARKLDSLEYDYEWEDYCDVEEINAVLSNSSKNGLGNIGKPDHIYINENKKLLILIEDKTQITNHSSYTKRKSYIDNCVSKAKLNAEIKKSAEKIDGKAEWVIQEYAKTDYSKLSTKSFVETIKDFIVYRVKRDLNLISVDVNPLTMSEILAQNIEVNFQNQEIPDEKIDIIQEDWKEVNVTDLFVGEIERCKCSVAGDLLDGEDIFYLGAKKKDGGIVRSVSYDETFVTKGNCIGFITDGNGSIGYHNYIDLDEFIGTSNLSVGYNPKINKYIGLFLVTILDLERPKYSFGRKYRSRIGRTKIMLPVLKDDSGQPKRNKEGNYEPDWVYMEEFIKKLPYADLL